MNDKKIIELFKTKKGGIDSNKVRLNCNYFLEQHFDIKEYLEHRYDPEPFMGFSYVVKCIFKGFTELPKCKTCNKILNDPNKTHCNINCADNDKNVLNKRKENMVREYGKYFVNVEKRLDTISKRTEEEKLTIINKRKNTNLNIHGDPNYNNMEKNKQTKLKNYGDSNYNNRDKERQTKLEKYNDPNYNNPEKNKETVEKHKLENPNYIQEKLNKAKQTCLERYNVESYAQTKESHKNRRKRYLYNNEKFDSSGELYFYIFYKDKGIKINHENISLEYYFDNKKYYYFPDFEIDNQLYEIKGEHFLDKETGEWINPFRNPKWTDKEYQDECEKYKAKYKCALENNVKIIYDCKKYKKYVENTYGKSLINQCKIA